MSGNAWCLRPHIIGPYLSIIIITPTINIASNATAGYKMIKAMIKCHFQFCVIQRILVVVVDDDVVDAAAAGGGGVLVVAVDDARILCVVLAAIFMH